MLWAENVNKIMRIFFGGAGGGGGAVGAKQLMMRMYLVMRDPEGKRVKVTPKVIAECLTNYVYWTAH